MYKRQILTNAKNPVVNMANIKVDAMVSGSGEGIGINFKKWFKPKIVYIKPSKRLEINNILLFIFTPYC